MDKQVAIHCLKVNLDESVCEECDVYGECGTDHCSQDASRIAISALEKQIPKKVEISRYNVAFCPVCNGSVWQIREESKYCFRCGQRLDWSNT